MAAGRTGIKSTHDAAIDPRLRPEAAYVCACCRCNSTPRLSVVVCTTRLDRHPCLRACARYDGPSKPVPDGGTASGAQSRPSTKVNKDQQAKAFAEAMRQRIHSRSGKRATHKRKTVTDEGSVDSSSAGAKKPSPVFAAKEGDKPSSDGDSSDEERSPASKRRREAASYVVLRVGSLRGGLTWTSCGQRNQA